MLGLILSATLCLANITKINNCDEAPVTIRKGISYGGQDKSGSIIVYINGHSLSVAFTENLGNVSIEIKDEGGATLDITGMGTPSGYAFYIPLAGRYTVFFKLSNGDEYYGDFEVTD